MRSRVTPGISSTMEIRLLTMALNNVDLPTFGRPTTATNGFDILSPHIVTPTAGG